MQFDPIKPTLKAPGTTLFKLKCDEPFSNFGFRFNLRRYSKVRRNQHVEIVPLSTGCLGACTYCKTKHARGGLLLL